MWMMPSSLSHPRLQVVGEWENGKMGEDVLTSCLARRLLRRRASPCLLLLLQKRWELEGSAFDGCSQCIRDHLVSRSKMEAIFLYTLHQTYRIRCIAGSGIVLENTPSPAPVSTTPHALSQGLPRQTQRDWPRARRPSLPLPTSPAPLATRRKHRTTPIHHCSRFRNDGLALAPLTITPSLDHRPSRAYPPGGVSGLS